MAQMSYYHFDGEIEGYHFDGECECEYLTDGDGEDVPRRHTMAFFDVVMTNKKTGESEYYDEDVPDKFLELIRELAEEEFIVA